MTPLVPAPITLITGGLGALCPNYLLTFTTDVFRNTGCLSTYTNIKGSVSVSIDKKPPTIQGTMGG